MPTTRSQPVITTTTTEERKALHAYLEEPSHDVWHTVAVDEGMSLSAFLESLAIDMRAHPPHEGGHPRWDDVVRTARRIDAARRRRDPGRRS